MNWNHSIKERRQRKLAIFLCMFISPSIFFLLYSWDWLIEILRVDNYGYGAKFFIVISLLSLLVNVLLVMIIRRSSSFKEKVELWLRGSILALLFAGLVILILLLTFYILWTGHWDFG